MRQEEHEHGGRETSKQASKQASRQAGQPASLVVVSTWLVPTEENGREAEQTYFFSPPSASAQTHSTSLDHWHPIMPWPKKFRCVVRVVRFLKRRRASLGMKPLVRSQQLRGPGR